MPDYEIFANTDADMKAALAILKMAKDGFRGGVRYSVNYYGTKSIWDNTWVSGIPVPNAPQVKNMVVQPGVYAIVRWVAANVVSNPFPPAGLTFPAGVTFSALPANSPIQFG